MITSLRLVDFKNFADETLRLGPFTVIVGANASGKSNIRDAFRFLHGIGRGYTLAEIMGGKHGAGGQLEWEPLRGAPNEIGRLDAEFNIPRSTFSIHIEVDQAGKEPLIYFIAVGCDVFGPNGYSVSREELKTESTTVYTTDRKPGHYDESLLWLQLTNVNMPISLSRAQPALGQFFQRYKEVYQNHISEQGLWPVLQNMRFMELSPEQMREPSIPGGTMLGDSGHNLPSVLEAICADSLRERNLMSWLQELSPMDIAGLEFPRDPSGRGTPTDRGTQRSQSDGVQRV